MKDIIYSIKRKKDGKLFSIGDKITYKGETGKAIVNDRVSRRKNRISRFEFDELDNSIVYVCYNPQYYNGVIDKNAHWRLCELKDAVLIK